LTLYPDRNRKYVDGDSEGHLDGKTEVAFQYLYALTDWAIGGR